MPAVVVFLIFVICLILAIPVSISRNCIGTSGSGRSVLYSKRNLCHPFYAWRNRQFPFACSSDVRTFRNYHGTGWDFKKII